LTKQTQKIDKAAPQGAGAPVLSEKPLFERQQEALNEIAELLDRCRNRMTFDGLNLYERYVGSNLKVVLHIRPLWDGHPMYAFFEVSKNTARHFGGMANRKKAMTASEITGHWHNGLVFVGRVECVEGEKKIIPSAVRLQSVDHFAGIGRETLYFFFRGGFKRLSIPAKGKVNIADFCSPIGAGEGHREVVQTRTQIVDRVANDPKDFIGDGLGRMDNQMLLFPVGVEIAPNGIGTCPEICRQLGLEIVDMAFGPFNL
jgi:hypothetical protein